MPTREPDDTDPAVADTTAAPDEPKPRVKLRAVHAGDTLGRYELVEEIGEGGMATVYRARDRELRREVAIKVLFGHLAKRPEIVQRFHREARAAANLEHANILRIYDVGGASEDGDPPYIVMELIKGRTLLQEIEQRGPVLAEIAACIGALLADALAAAHAKGIIHRDIKPANVLIAQGGRLLLADFGVARLETEDSLVTKTGALLGTPAYMSPEQASGDTATAKSDLYSLGATLYQLATGSLPYTGSPAKIMASIATGGMVSAVRRRPAVGPDLSRAIDRLMKVDPEERPENATESAAELRALAASGGLGDATDELAAFFDDADKYLASRTPTVVGALVREAEKAATTGRLPRAMALADRASALAPDDPAVKTLVDRVTTRSTSRAPKIAIIGIAVIAIAAGGIFIATRSQTGSGSGSGSTASLVIAAVADAQVISEPEPEPVRVFDASIAIDAVRVRVVPKDAAVAMVSAPIDAPPIVPIDAAPIIIRIDAPPEPGTIVVDNDIWCDIAIDGQPRGRERGKPLAVPAGSHTVSCANGAKRWEETVAVVPGKTVHLKHEMLGKIAVRFEVDATLDGVAHKPGETITVTPGGHQLGTSFLDFSAPCVVRRTPDLDCVR